jgi:hypothetical protein
MATSPIERGRWPIGHTRPKRLPRHFRKAAREIEALLLDAGCTETRTETLGLDPRWSASSTSTRNCPAGDQAG